MAQTPPNPPPVLANARVLEYAVLGKNVSYSGHSSLFVDGKELGPVPCLVICQSFDRAEALLLHCDRDWNVLGLAGYTSLAEAKQHAERIYPGVSAHWTKANVTEAKAPKDVKEDTGDLRCSFCGRGPEEVNQLIEKGGVGICDSCILELHQMLHEG
jgi:hypothetical protein